MNIQMTIFSGAHNFPYYVSWFKLSLIICASLDELLGVVFAIKQNIVTNHIPAFINAIKI